MDEPMHAPSSANTSAKGEIPEIKSAAYWGSSAFQISGNADGHKEVGKAIVKQMMNRQMANKRREIAIIQDTTNEAFLRTLASYTKQFDEQVSSSPIQFYLTSYCLCNFLLFSSHNQRHLPSSSLFFSQMKEFLERLHIDSYRLQPQLANLCVRIDYNGYYSGRFDGGPAKGR